METRTCWSCRLAQAAGYVRGSWSTVSGRLTRAGRSRKSKASSSTTGSRSGWPEDNRAGAGGAQGLVQGQRVLIPEPTIKSPVVVSYPKITTGPGPSQVKRKLGSNHWDTIHERLQGQKRDGGQCGPSYQSCPASLNGGCCPNDRICGSSSCLPNTSTTVASACGKANYVACGIPEGGGCCPSDYICATNGCTPSPGVSVTSTCSAGFYLCPAEVNYGCCRNGLGCAINSCYTTDPVTFTVTETIKTTDSNSIVHTITTTITSETIVGAPTTTAAAVGGVVSKMSALPITNTPIAKTSPTSTSAPSSGLTKTELGGIIGGACVFLLVIIIAAFFILRKLNKAIKVTELANSRTTSSERRSRRSRQTQSMQQDVDAMSVDPLMMTPSEFSHSIRRSSQQSALHTTTHELASPNSPPVFQHPFRTMSPTQYQTGYTSVASSESHYSGSNAGYQRSQSTEISPPIHHNTNTGYFDWMPQKNPRHSQVSSIPGRRPSQHGRNWSDASDLSAASQSSDAAELDGDERRSSIQRSLNKLRRSFSRKKSDPPVLSGGPARADWQGLNNLAGGLGHIAEAGESRIAVDSSQAVFTNAELREISLMDQPVRFEGREGNPDYDQKFIGRRIDVIGMKPARGL